jgi:hypothetical protein
MDKKSINQDSGFVLPESADQGAISEDIPKNSVEAPQVKDAITTSPGVDKNQSNVSVSKQNLENSQTRLYWLPPKFYLFKLYKAFFCHFD